MKTQSAMVAGLLIACNVSYASDCSPGSPIYEDTFFKYCDDARAAYEPAVPLTSAVTDDGAVAARAESGEPARLDQQKESVPTLSSGTGAVL